jgi:hypothetical protein
MPDISGTPDIFTVAEDAPLGLDVAHGMTLAIE